MSYVKSDLNDNIYRFEGRLETESGKMLFVDEDFPKDFWDARIEDPRTGVAQKEREGVYWIRASDLYPSNCKEVASCNVKQGDVGNCMLLASIACMSTKSGSSIVTKKSPGQYEVTFSVKDKKGDGRSSKSVTVDDYLPCFLKPGMQPWEIQNFEPIFAGVARVGENVNWNMLFIEKAVAKLRAGYYATTSLYIEEPLQLLGAGPVRLYLRVAGSWTYCPLESHGQRVYGPELKDDDFKSVLFEGLSEGRYMTGSNVDIDQRKTKDNLYAMHEYSILKMGNIKFGESFHDILQVRNPHGLTDGWKGRFGADKEIWKNVDVASFEGFADCQMKDCFHDGVFYVEWDEFNDNFTRIFLTEN